MSIPSAVIEVEGGIVIDDPNFVEIGDDDDVKSILEEDLVLERYNELFENVDIEGEHEADELDYEITSSEVNSGSDQDRRQVADEAQLAETHTRTLPRSELLTEMRGPKITEAALRMFGGVSQPTNNPNELKLCPFIEMQKEGLHAVAEEEWILVEVIADSGACETVMPKTMCSGIRLRESKGSKAGTEYEVASGKSVPNLGERHCEVDCEGAASSMLMHFQVADIHRPLLSLSRAADQGFTSHLDMNGGYLEDSMTGERIPIQRRGNLYIMSIWIRGNPESRPPDTSGFARPGW